MEWLVEIVAFTQPVTHFDTRFRIQVGLHVSRLTGRQMNDHETDQRDADQQGDHHEQAFGEISQHKQMCSVNGFVKCDQ